MTMKLQIYNAECILKVLGADIHVNRLVASPRKTYTIAHPHSYCELHFLTEGHMEYLLEFKETVELHAGEWLLINKNVYHEERPRSLCQGYCLGFEINANSSASPFAFLASDRKYYKQINDSYLKEMLERMLVEDEEKQVGYKESCEKMLSLVFIHLLRCCVHNLDSHHEDSIETKQINIRRTVDNFFNEFNENVCQKYGDTQKVDVNQLAAELHVSRRHVNRILHEYYGMSFEEMVLERKLKLAEHLLLNTSKSIAEISEICGFSPSYLNRTFKEKFKTTPAKYRKMNQGDTI